MLKIFLHRLKLGLLPVVVISLIVALIIGVIFLACISNLFFGIIMIAFIIPKNRLLIQTT